MLVIGSIPNSYRAALGIYHPSGSCIILLKGILHGLLKSIIIINLHDLRVVGEVSGRNLSPLEETRSQKATCFCKVVSVLKQQFGIEVHPRSLA